jgi:hypothetical protein
MAGRTASTGAILSQREFVRGSPSEYEQEYIDSDMNIKSFRKNRRDKFTFESEHDELSSIKSKRISLPVPNELTFKTTYLGR